MPLNGTGATSPTAHLDAGDHVISADYQGDARFAGASDNLDQEVDAAQTTTTVTTSPNPSVVGQPITIRAEVAAGAPPPEPPAGAVRFVDRRRRPCDFVDLVNGAAEIQVSDLGVGNHTMRAIYLSADPNFATSTSDRRDPDREQGGDRRPW